MGAFVVIGDTAYSLDSNGSLRSQRVLGLQLDLPVALNPGTEGPRNMVQYELIRAALHTAETSEL